MYQCGVFSACQMRSSAVMVKEIMKTSIRQAVSTRRRRGMPPSVKYRIASVVVTVPVKIWGRPAGMISSSLNAPG